MPLEDWRLLPFVLPRDGGTGLALEGGAASPPILRQISVPEFPGLANEARPGIGGCSSESGMHNGWRGTVQDGTGWAPGRCDPGGRGASDVVRDVVRANGTVLEKERKHQLERSFLLLC